MRSRLRLSRTTQPHIVLTLITHEPESLLVRRAGAAAVGRVGRRVRLFLNNTAQIPPSRKPLFRHTLFNHPSLGLSFLNSRVYSNLEC